MKLGVDGRFFSDPQTLSRGMGRYTLNQVAALGDHRSDVEMTLLLRPDGREAWRRIAPRLRVAEIPEELCKPCPSPVTRADRMAREAEYSEWLSGLGLDALLATTPFLLGLEPFPPLPGACPTVVNLFDLIPLVFRKQYLVRGSPFESEYLGVLERLPFGDAFVAISDFVRRESIAYLGIPARKVHVGHPIPASVFRPIPPDESRAVAARLGVARKGAEGFVLTVPHTHHTKNIRTLLDAWSGLPAPFRRRRTLALTCDLSSPESELLRSWTREAGIENEVVHTGFVSDEDLAALYSAAWLYVHPSRYEGFGLPVVEAQACGTAVVSSSAASLPEAVGDGGLLVDPEDPVSFRDALLRLDGEPELLEDLRRRAPASAARFTAKRLADAIVMAAETAIEARRPGRTRPRPVRVAIVSPVPPQASGVADYTAELAGAIGLHAQVEVFVDERVSPVSALCRWPFHDIRRLAERCAEPGFDAVFHQMGASSFHVFTEKAMQAVPGIVTLHDLLWGRVLYHLGRSPEGLASLEEKLARLEGPEALAEFRRILATDGTHLDDRLDEFFGRNPVIGDIVRASRGVVVHFPEGARRLRERYPEVPVRSFPMGVADPLRSGIPSLAATRGLYGLPSGEFVLGVFGIADPVKRLDVTVRALAGLLRRGRRARLAIVGRFSKEGYRAELKELATRLDVADRVHLLGAPPLESFEALLGCCDAVVNLRFPSHLQMSATLTRALAAGKPVAITDLPEWRFLPEGPCERIPVGEDEVVRLETFLDQMIEDPAERERRGAAARSWYLANATLEAMAANYLAFARELAGGTAGAAPETRTP